jgi:hypothetical protein
MFMFVPYQLVITDNYSNSYVYDRKNTLKSI